MFLLRSIVSYIIHRIAVQIGSFTYLKRIVFFRLFTIRIEQRNGKMDMVGINRLNGQCSEYFRFTVIGKDGFTAVNCLLLNATETQRDNSTFIDMPPCRAFGVIQNTAAHIRLTAEIGIIDSPG